MARIARIVISNHPHHIIHRGNRREKVFFNEDDKQAYLRLLTNQAKKSGIEFWTYCLLKGLPEGYCKKISRDLSERQLSVLSLELNNKIGLF